VVTAALAAVSDGGAGRTHDHGNGATGGPGGPGTTVAVVKPAQTGAAEGEPGDLAEVRRLAGAVHTAELARYPDPLSPEAAARAAGLPPLDHSRAVTAIRTLAASHDKVIVEGAGGLLVRYAPDGWTLADLAAALRAPVVLVTGAALGTLNHTALTLEALANRGLALAGLVIGSWPAQPGITERNNLLDLETLAGRPLSGALPAGAGGLDGTSFRRLAPLALAPWLGGSLDPARFRETNLP
jgi:dethiobiotin synthetase